MFSKSVLKLQSCDLRTSCEEFRREPVTTHCSALRPTAQIKTMGTVSFHQQTMSVGGLTIKNSHHGSRG